tara:strand:- start:662 stop:874 length:213 start_codon:yes stop_codon:yes gene_type:complete
VTRVSHIATDWAGLFFRMSIRHCTTGVVFRSRGWRRLEGDGHVVFTSTRCNARNVDINHFVTPYWRGRGG